VLLALAILMAWRFPITRQMHADIRAQLAERGN
jgi:Na+/melibiose symporter-like transporter